MGPTPDCGASAARRSAEGDPMEPGTQRIAHPQRASLAGQYEERRLEGILGLMLIAQDRPADPEYHRAMPLHQGGERRLVVPGRIALHQISIRQTTDDTLIQQRVDAPKNVPPFTLPHGQNP